MNGDGGFNGKDTAQRIAGAPTHTIDAHVKGLETELRAARFKQLELESALREARTQLDLEREAARNDIHAFRLDAELLAADLTAKKGRVGYLESALRGARVEKERHLERIAELEALLAGETSDEPSPLMRVQHLEKELERANARLSCMRIVLGLGDGR